MFKFFFCFTCLFILIGESAFASTNALRTSYFESQITPPTQAEAIDMLSDIQLGTYRLRSQIEINRLSNTQRFIYQAKREAAKRYEQGRMNNYEMVDFARELGYLTHNMNEYFKNIVASQRTNNRAIRALARQNLRDADQSYGRLSAVTRKSVR